MIKKKAAVLQRLPSINMGIEKQQRKELSKQHIFVYISTLNVEMVEML